MDFREPEMAESVRVLIVDDDLLTRTMIRETLEVMPGYVTVGEAEDGLEAVRMTCDLQPDVVLMDIKIPTLDGIEAARRISDLCPTPVVMVSAFESSDLIKKAGGAGAGAYLIKPINAKDMERAITIARSRHEDLMQLRRLNEDLKAREEDVDAFANAVAHDLQNPLALLIGFAEALRKYHQTMPAEDFEISLQNIEQSGWRISQIMDRLLLLAQARKLEPELAPLNLTSIVARARKRLAPLITEHDVRIILPTTWPKALGQESWVEEVWVNYLQYAIRHCRSTPPTLELDAVELDDGMVKFSIRDDGRGAELDEIFEPLPPPRPKSGLGLSLARRIVDRLGGRIAIESEGAETVYTFTLPGPDYADRSRLIRPPV
jgi:two-component system sensor histidine kinase/response regulator